MSPSPIFELSDLSPSPIFKLGSSPKAAVLYISVTVQVELQRKGFVCVGCKGTCTKCTLFLTRKAASVHNARNKSCNGTGIKRIAVETSSGDREVGGSGACGSIPDLRHQKPGNNPIYVLVSVEGDTSVIVVYTSVH